jgi:hypothetical protein
MHQEEANQIEPYSKGRRPGPHESVEQGDGEEGDRKWRRDKKAEGVE